MKAEPDTQEPTVKQEPAAVKQEPEAPALVKAEPFGDTVQVKSEPAYDTMFSNDSKYSDPQVCVKREQPVHIKSEPM